MQAEVRPRAELRVVMVICALACTLGGVAACSRIDQTGCPPSGLPAERGLQSDTVLVLRCVHRDFPEITTFHGVRQDPLVDHPSGRAVDIMIPDHRSAEGQQHGDRIVHYLQRNSEQLGVDYLIWRQHIWSVEREAEGWRAMSDRGSPTANHLDHIHVTTVGEKADADPVSVPEGEGDPPATSPPGGSSPSGPNPGDPSPGEPGLGDSGLGDSGLGGPGPGDPAPDDPGAGPEDPPPDGSSPTADPSEGPPPSSPPEPDLTEAPGGGPDG